jgi:hypothetical protein
VLSEERAGPGATSSSSKAEYCSAKECSILQSGSVQSSVVQYSSVRCRQQREWRFGTPISHQMETVIFVPQRSSASFIAHAKTEEKEWSGVE